MIVNVEVSPWLVRFVRSPAFYIIMALSGASVSFAPLFLYQNGQGQFYPAYHRFLVPLLFAVIVLVPAAYFRVADPLIRELRKK